MDTRIDLLKRQIRDIPDFPKPGIIFKDITPLLASPEALKATLDLLLESGSADGLPLTRATETSVLPTAGVIVVDKLIGPPLQLKPAPGGALQGNTLAWSQSGGSHDLAVTILRLPDETPVWRILSPGSTTQVQLPDPPTFGLPAWPKGPVLWLQWLARLPGFSYDNFTYSQLSSAYWDRWSFDELGFTIP